MAREKRHKDTRKSYAIVGEGIAEFFYFGGFRNSEKELLKRHNITLKPDKPKRLDYSNIIVKARLLLTKEFRNCDEMIAEFKKEGRIAD